MSQVLSADFHEPKPGPRLGGVILGAATIVGLVGLSFHPGAGGSTPAEIFAQMVETRAQDHAVHGLMIAVLIGFAFGFTEFAARIGIARPLVRLGLIPYLIGCTLTIMAAVVDGFVLPDLARHYLAAAPEDMKTGFALVILCSGIIWWSSKIGLTLVAAGILAWAAELWSTHRTISIIGLFAGLAPIALIFGLPPALQSHLMIMILAANAVWNLAVARLLMRKPA